jgi:hypothetical protein
VKEAWGAHPQLTSNGVVPNSFFANAFLCYGLFEFLNVVNKEITSLIPGNNLGILVIVNELAVVA